MAIFNGTPGNDTLVGSAGSVDDVLNGGLGNDLYRYRLGSGNDVITDTGGADTIEVDDPLSLFQGIDCYRSGNDLIIDFHGQGQITVTNQYLAAPIIERLTAPDGWGPFFFSNSLTPSAGNDALVGTSAAEAINGDNGNDLIFGNEGDDTLSGGDGDDDLWGGTGNDSLYGGAGDDELDGQGGANVIDGGDGWDSVGYSLESGGLTINFSGATKDISGHSLADGHVLHADGVTEDTLVNIEGVDGSDYADVYYAGAPGHPSFHGGKGNDTVVCGTDSSSWIHAEYWEAPLGIIVNLSDASITANGVTLASKTARDGFGFTDSFVLGAGQLAIEGSDKDDYIRGRDDRSGWLDGADGNDTIVGGAFADTANYDNDSDGTDGGIYGAIVNLSESSITVTGVTGYAGGVTVGNLKARDSFGDTDTLSSIENIWGSARSDFLLGSSAANSLAGNAENDTLDGGAGNVDDTLNGGLGDDVYRYSLGSGNDVITDTGGADTIELDDPLYLFSGWNFYRNGNDLVIDFNGQGRVTVTNQFLGAPVIESLTFAGDTDLYSFSNLLTGTAGYDVLIGTASGEVINGGGGDDLIFGNEGDDTLFGGDGEDELSGGPGIDALYGDAGDDEMHVLKGDSVVDGGAGEDEATFYLEAGGVAVNFSGTTQDVLGHLLADGNVLHADGVTETTLTSVEEDVVGSDYGDVFFGGRTGFVDFRGGKGNDTIVGGTNASSWVWAEYWDTPQGIIVNLSNGSITANGVTLASKTARDGFGFTDSFVLGAGQLAIEGSEKDDYIRGRDDRSGWLDGADGNDTIVGGAFADTAAYDNDSDGTDGGIYGAIVNLSASSITVNGVTGYGSGVTVGGLKARDSFGDTDTLSSIENIWGSARSDFLMGSSAANWLAGTEGNDTLDGGAGNDTLHGDEGADMLRGGAGNDTLDGGSITDPMGGTDFNLATYDTSTAGVTINLGAGAGIGNGSASDGLGGTDTLININRIRGSNLADLITGSTALIIEEIEGGLGNDTLNGGVITDTVTQRNDNRVSYENAAGAVTVDLAAGTASGAAGSDTLLNFSQVRGSAANDTLLGSNSALIERFEGGAGNDTFDGRGGADRLFGGLGNDNLLGGSGSDTLDAGPGLDTVDGGADTDTLIVLGNFADYARTRPSATDTRLFNATTGEDIILRNVESVTFLDGSKSLADVRDNTASPGNDSIVGTAGNDTLDGLAGADTLVGLGGNDTLIGGTGSDSLVGGPGDDTYVVDIPSDVITENLSEGNDQASINFMSSGTYTLAANVENATIANGTAGVNLTGNELNNFLTGNAAANLLSGLDGNDMLFGNAGIDTLVGGLGNDSYVIDTLADVVTENPGEGSDGVFVLLAAGATYTLAANVENAQIGNTTLGVNLTGNALDNTLQGNSQANVLNGSTGNDALYGNAGNDTLLGGAGSDFLRGDAGNDSIDGGVTADRINYTDGNTVSYANSTGAVNVNLSGITGTGSTGTGTASDGLGGTDTLANIFYVQGSSQDDTLVGSAALTLEVFEGRAGNDTINGGAITDTLNGENSNRVSYQNAAVAVNVNLATGTATSAADTGAGSDGNDTLININQVRGSSHADTLTGSDDLVLTEQFEGRAGADTIDGAGGLDLVRYDNAATGVDVDLAGGTASDGYGTTDTLSNIEGARGSKFDDTLSGGNAANDALEFFMGLEGNDTIDGGSGYDRAEYTLSTAGVNVTLGGAGSGTASDGYGTTDTLISIEGVRGSAFYDTLTGSNAADIFESFEGREGNDTINGMGGTDQVVYTASKAGVTVNLTTGTASDGYGGTDSLNNIEDVLGSRDFNDSLTGSAADNKLEGQGGNDTLDGGLGNDSLLGGLGNDNLFGAAGADTLAAGPGLDTVDGGADADTLVVLGNFADYTRTRPNATDTRLVNAGTGEDVTFRNVESVVFLDGTRTLADVHLNIVSANNDVIVGTPGNDTLDGLAGTDTLVGLDGDDTYFVDVASDVVTEGDGAGSGSDRVNVVFTAGGTYMLAANVENATIANATAGVNVTGNELNNFLTGNAAANLLTGLGGNDTLDGGLGIDTLVGGLGNDIYAIDTLADVITENPGEGNDGVAVLLAAGATYTLAANVENAGIGNATPGVNLTGNALDNTLQGNSQANVLNGSTGNDALYGNAGNDTLLGGAGSDFLRGDAGNDSIDGAAGADTLAAGPGLDTVDGGADADTLVVLGNFADYTRTRPNATDTRLVNVGTGEEITFRNVESVVFLDGPRTLADVHLNIVSANNDSIVGTAGNDTLDGLAGADTLVGLDGDDTYVVDVAGDVVAENPDEGSDRVNVVFTAGGTYTLAANVENATIANGTAGVNVTGNALDNVLLGNAAANLLTGLGGNDTLDGNAGIDTLVGGLGNDSYTVDVPADVITESPGEGTDRVNVLFASAGTYVLAANVENAQIGNSTPGVNLTGNGLVNNLVGNGQANLLAGLDGNDTLDGAAGDDNLDGGLGNDSLVGGLGNDTLAGGTGDDTLQGNEGNDLYLVDSALDVVGETAEQGLDRVDTALASYTLSDNVETLTYTGASAFAGTGNAVSNSLVGAGGNDTLSGEAGDDTLIGNAGSDTLDGGTGNDSMGGGLGDDTLGGGAGNDTLQGNEGNDLYVVDSALDVVTELAGQGLDRVDTDLASYTLGAEVEQLRYTGTSDFIGNGQGLNNHLTGGTGNDSLSGLGGNDTLIGNAGNDTLDGGLGTDSLVGGAGDDLYRLDVLTDAVSESATEGTDRVELALSAGGTYTLTAHVEHAAMVNATPGVNLVGNTENNALTSNATANSLSGLAGDDTLDGAAGDDNLDGGLGNDSLVGGLGNDTLAGGTGDDTLQGNEGNDLYLVDSALDVVGETAEQGLDRVDTALASYTLSDNVETLTYTGASAFAGTGNAVNNSLVGGGANDTLSGEAGNDTLIGNAGNDTLDGGAGNDSMGGGLGDDTLGGGAGNDTLQGNEGNDLYVVDSALDVVTELAGQGLDRVDTDLASYTLGAEVEQLRYIGVDDFIGTGQGLNNHLTGGAGDDTLIGLAGNDTLDGGAGNNSLVGGAGDDVYLVSEAGDAVVEATLGGVDRVDTALASYTLSAEVEQLRYTGVDDFIGSGQGLNNHLTGGAGNDSLSGLTGNDTLIGLDGNDTLDGGLGNDSLVGGTGDDVYRLDVLSDVLSDVVSESAGEGIDQVELALTAAGSYTLTANVEGALVTSPDDSFAVNVTGNTLANALTGHAGSNLLVGLDGDDTLDGGGGNDTLDGGIGSDTAILPGVLIDYVISRLATTRTSFTHLPSGNTVVISNVEVIRFAGGGSPQPLADLIARIGSPGNDVLNGTGGDDTLAGVLGNDSLSGGAGNDDLQGGEGIDTLAGGAGNDLLDGGAGSDVYQFDSGGGDDIIEQNDPLAGSLDTVELASPIGGLGSGETTLTRGWHSYDDLVITVNSGTPGAEVVDHLVVHDFLTSDLINLGTIDQIRFSNGSVLTQTQILAELLKGSSGDDWLRGYANTNDSINGAGGNDTLGGAAGNDTLAGGLGNDSLSGDAGADSLDGGAGNDQVVGGDGNDTLTGSGGNDTLSGEAGSDTYVFGPGFGQDVIADRGASGEVDTLKFNVGIRPAEVGVARAGNDLVVSFAGAPGDGVRISDFFDETFSALGLNRQIEQFAFADGSTWSATAIRAKVLVPTAGDDEITGYLGSESLAGLAGDDTISGGAGNDTLSGGDGTDRLTGGSGADRFVFDTADALVHADLITDFVSGVDRIALKASVFAGLGRVGDVVALGDHLSYDSSTGALAYDADGAGGGGAVTFATLGVGTHPATLGMDFLIV